MGEALRAVQIRNGELLVRGRRVPVLSGEVHYWRLNPGRWRRVLDRARGAGLSMIGVYVPWEYHELEPGRFDFDGSSNPARDLIGFLRLAEEAGLRVFFRPGPFIYAEWTNAGVPDRVVGLPRISEAYRSEARVWMEAVTRAAEPFFATRREDGPIVLFQPDNEVDLFSHWFEAEVGLDAPERAEAGAGVGVGGGGGGGGVERPTAFERFLRERYGAVEALNAAWGTGYAAFAEAQAWAEAPDPLDLRHLRRRRDYWRFQHWATREIVGWHADEYRRLGVDLPMLANFYPGGDVQNWREAVKPVDAVGIDWYPRRRFGADRPGEANPSAEFRRVLDTIRYTRAVSALPIVPELECGVWHGWHEHIGTLDGQQIRLVGIATLLAGATGFNWYMLVGRDNWYYTPIDERGDARGPEFEAVAGVNRIAAEMGLGGLRRATDVGAVFEPEHVGPDRTFERNAVLDALHAGDVDFEMVDLAGDGRAFARTAPRVLVYAAGDWLARASQERLAALVEEGRHLIVFAGQRPRRDDAFGPLDVLGVREPDRVLSRLGKKVEVGFGGLVGTAEGAVGVWDTAPEGAEAIVGEQAAGKQQAVENADKWMTRYIGRRWTVGYRVRRGAGSVTVLGVEPSATVLRAAAGRLGAAPASEAELPGVTTAVYERTDGGRFLVAVNLSGAERVCPVRLGRAARGAVDLWDGAELAVAGERVLVRLGAWSGTVVRLEGE